MNTRVLFRTIHYLAFIILLEIKSFKIKQDLRARILRINKIAAVEQTEMKVLSAGTRASVCQMALRPPNDLLYTKDFSKLERSPEYMVNVSGIVAEVNEERMSTNGNPMQVFQLRDEKGRFVNCYALGRHAGNEMLEEGNMIVMYFATAKKNKGGQGQLWLYDDSHIVKLRGKVSVPVGKSAVNMQD